MKIAKVLGQFEKENKQKLFIEDVYGACELCGELVCRNQYGADEYCPSCGAELDWSEVE